VFAHEIRFVIETLHDYRPRAAQVQPVDLGPKENRRENGKLGTTTMGMTWSTC
jgi:hypothetical protein